MRRLQRAIKREPRRSVSNTAKSEKEMEVRGNARRRRSIVRKKKDSPGVGMSDRDITPFLRNSIPLEFTS